jgi:hypothetical protein
MGYAAVTGDMLKNLQAQKPGAPAPAPGAPPPAAAPPAAAAAPPPAAMAPPPAQPIGVAATMMAPAPGMAPPAMAPPPAMGAPPAMGQPPFGAPPAMAPPPAMGQPPFGAPPPMAAPPPAQGPQLPQFGAPGSFGAPQAPAPAPTPGPQLGGGFGGMGAGLGGGMGGVVQEAPSADKTESVRSFGKPKFLASETNSRAMAPVEPWAGLLRTLMIVFGAALVVTFIAPWAMGHGRTVFAWDAISHEKGADKLIPIYVVLAGVLALAGGLMPASARVRGTLAGLAGGIIIGGVVFAGLAREGDAKELSWRVYALTLGLLTGPAALLVRAKYPASNQARLLGTIAAVLVLSVFLVPIHGKIPFKLMAASLDELKGEHTLGPKLVIYALYLLAAAGAASLVVWVKPSQQPAATAIAWGQIAILPVFLFTMTVLAPVIMKEAKAGEILKRPGITIYPTVWLLAAFALAAYGQATVMGKKHEQA